MKRLLPMNQVRAELGSVDEKNRTVEVTWSTGSKGIRQGYGQGWDGPYYEELSMKPEHVDMSRLNSGAAPVLAAHNKYDLDGVHGVVDKAWLENGVGKAVLRFSASDPEADKTFQKIKERILRNISVGYSVQKYQDVSQKDDEVPTLRAVAWQPQEISVVPVGFDMKATTRDNQSQHEVEIITCDGQSAEGKNNMEPKDLTLKERARVTGIQRAVKAAKLSEELATNLIERGVDMETASAEIFKQMEEREQGEQINSRVHVEVGRTQEERREDGLKNYLLNRLNPTNKLNEAGREFAGKDMVRAIEQWHGGRPFQLTNQQFITRAMTTSDLPNILANVAEKQMRQAYEAQPPTFRPFVKQGTLRNYKPANRLMLGDAPQLEAVDEHGQFKADSTSESKETIQLVRYGKQIAFTKEMIINDDLSALADFSARFAFSANNVESDLVYNILKNNPTMGNDSTALFHANHGNLDGTGAAISATSLGAAYAAMGKQQSLNGNYLNLVPKYLVVAPEKWSVAQQAVSTALLANQLSNVNPFAGKLQVISDARLSALNSGLSWFLIGDPSACDTIELALLEGEQGPLINVKPTEMPGGVLMQCEHNVGAQALDYRNMYKNVGA